MSKDETTYEVKLERAKHALKAGATLEQAATQCGLDPAALQACLSSTGTRAEAKTKKPSSRFEVNFWLPY